jgi:hypothetical protein
MKNNRIARVVTRILKITLMVVAGFALFSFLVMRLWNWLAPEVFGWHTITFWQAVGLFFLSKLLFGGFRGGWGHRGHWRRGMQERWENMTPEQREMFRKGMKGCMFSQPAGGASTGVEPGGATQARQAGH